MNFKKLNFIIFIILSLLLCSCSTTNENRNKSSKNVNTTYPSIQSVLPSPKSEDNNASNKIATTFAPINGDKLHIISESGTLPNNIVPCCMIDPQNFIIVGDKGKSYYKYNIKSKQKKLIQTVIEKQKFIWRQYYSNGWLVWCELESKEGEFPTGVNWSIYAKNLYTGKILDIDKYNKNIKIDESVVTKFGGGVFDMSLSGNKLVYNCFDLKGNETYQVIKLYDLSTNKIEIIDERKDQKDKLTGVPSISSNNIVWSVSTFKSSITENGYIYLYDINTKKKSQISFDDEIVKPVIDQNYIVATKKPFGANDNGEVLLYDINDPQAGWKSIAGPNYPLYKEYQHLNVSDYRISGKYVYWRNNVKENILQLFNISDKKYYTLAYSNNPEETFLVYLLSNNVIVWGEGVKDNINMKYAILK